MCRQTNDLQSTLSAWYHQHLNTLGVPADTDRVALGKFLWAFALVQSRALAIEMPGAADGVATALVPVLELANHDAAADSGHHFDCQVIPPHANACIQAALRALQRA